MAAKVDPKRILNDHPEIQQVKQLEGVMRIDIEYYSIMGQNQFNPIFVVICNSNFHDRPKIPNSVEGIRMIVSYEEAITKEEQEKIEKMAEEEDSSDDDEKSNQNDAPDTMDENK